ncbi:MAG TPA: hypothetical protein PKL57_14835, partial [Candidatus Wallbacteria bacterium]|nr:hypothetical protein [Candidatus Wallbacteria bacterium]
MSPNLFEHQYIQFRATLTTRNKTITPAVSKVRIKFVRSGDSPVSFALSGGGLINKDYRMDDKGDRIGPVNGWYINPPSMTMSVDKEALTYYNWKPLPPPESIIQEGQAFLYAPFAVPWVSPITQSQPTRPIKAEGKSTIYQYSVDYYGNYEPEYTMEVFLDTVPPIPPAFSVTTSGYVVNSQKASIKIDLSGDSSFGEDDAGGYDVFDIDSSKDNSVFGFSGTNETFFIDTNAVGITDATLEVGTGVNNGLVRFKGTSTPGTDRVSMSKKLDPLINTNYYKNMFIRLRGDISDLAVPSSKPIGDYRVLIRTDSGRVYRTVPFRNAVQLKPINTTEEVVMMKLPVNERIDMISIEMQDTTSDVSLDKKNMAVWIDWVAFTTAALNTPSPTLDLSGANKTFTLSNISDNTTHEIILVRYDARGNYGINSKTIVTPDRTEPPSPVVNLYMSDGGANSGDSIEVVCHWKGVKDGHSKSYRYNVDVSITDGAADEEWRRLNIVPYEFGNKCSVTESVTINSVEAYDFVAGIWTQTETNYYKTPASVLGAKYTPDFYDLKYKYIFYPETSADAAQWVDKWRYVTRGSYLGEYFKSRGFTQINTYADLALIMNTAVGDGTCVDTLVLLPYGTVPFNIIDNAVPANTTLRKFLNLGGTVTWLGDFPLEWSYNNLSDYKINSGSLFQNILSVTPQRVLSGPTYEYLSIISPKENGVLLSFAPRIGLSLQPEITDNGVNMVDIRAAYTADAKRAYSWLATYDDKYPTKGFIRYLTKVIADGFDKEALKNIYNISTFANIRAKNGGDDSAQDYYATIARGPCGYHYKFRVTAIDAEGNIATTGGVSLAVKARDTKAPVVDFGTGLPSDYSVTI